MSIQDLLDALAKARISLKTANGNLEITAPQGGLTDSLKTSLRQHKAELIEILQSGRQISGGRDGNQDVTAPANPITRETTAITPEMLPLIALQPADIDRIVSRVPGGIANIQDIYALSPLQDGILFHHLLAAEGDPYLLVSQMTFANRAVLDRFVQAAQQVVDRHDILRTGFQWEGLSTSAQVVWRHAPLMVTEVSLDPAEAGTAGEKLARRFDPRQHRIDLTQAPLLRFAIAQDPDGERWVGLQLQHHLIGDHSTLESLQAEMSVILSGHGSTLPRPLPFRNFVAQNYLGLTTEAHEKYFREQLGDIDEPTLPFGLSDVHLDGDRVVETYRQLPQALNDRLRAQARRLGVSLASLCHLAFGQVLARASGRQSVVFGTVLFGRMQGGAGADRAVGLFINTLPLRLDLDETPVEDSALQAHQRLSRLLQHEHASLGLALRCSGVAAPTPLFSALLNYRHSRLPDAASDNAVSPFQGIELLGTEERTNYPLTVSVDDYGHALGLTVQVAESLSSERICDFMNRALAQLAEALETRSRRPVRQLDVLPDDERQLLLQTWNQTQTYPADRCIHSLFEDQVRHNPDAIAVSQGEMQLSYGALNAQANRLAHRLIELGVRPESRVALCVDRRPHLVVGLLAILKAGGAYVPLDPAYPVERLVEVLVDSQPVLLICDAAGREALAAAVPAALILLDLEASTPEWSADSEHDSNPEIVGLAAHHVAYVIYTSGSTGKPKGVMVEHAQVVRLFEASQHWYGFNAQDVWCLFHSFAFDFSVWELWGALRYGGRLVIPSWETTRSASEFYRLVCDTGVTVLNQTPSAFRTFIEARNQSATPHSLRYVIFGGEALEPAILKPWYATHSDHSPRLINMYGITETTVHVTYKTLQSADTHASDQSIGHRIPDLRIYLLDAYGQPVPLGAVGELYIGGAGVARGYLNRPELTAERFLDDPFCSEPGARMYRSGDLARYRSDGNLDYLGRSDHQVKIRGFRIELGEIEARLAVHPTVRDAVVIARDEGGGNKRLVAYVTAQPETEIDVPDLRAHLLRQLPDYMVPAAFVRLDQLPLTTNGKLDRKALPAPDQSSVIAQQYEAPQGDVETTLAGIWSELLGIERIGRNDHFFELGGHSLLAVQMIERLRRAGLSIEVRALFAHPTLSALAATLGSSREVVVPANAITPETTAITPAMLPLIDLQSADIARIVERVPGGVANIQDIYALSPLQDGILFHHLLATEGDPYLLVSQMRFADRPLLDRFLEAAQQVVDRHDILRTAIQWEGLSTSAQVVWRQAPLIVTEVTLDPGDAGTAAEQLARRFDPRQHRIDLMQPPLLRFVIAQEPDSERWAMLGLMHHIIDDNSSLTILYAEVAAILSGQGSTLGPTQPYRNLVAQTRLGVTAEEHEQFFRKQLGDIDEPTLPFGLSDASRDNDRVIEHARMLPLALTDQLRMQARRLGVSLASLCHLAWGQVLARTSGRESVVFGTVLFGRMQGGEGADRAMGLFINTLPLRLDLDGTSVEDSVRKAHQQLAELLQHEHASLAMAQRCSGVAAPTPLFSALLNYRHNRLQEATAENATSPFEGIELLNAEERTNYPLTMSVDDYGQAVGLTILAVESLSTERMCDFMQRSLEQLAEALETKPTFPVRQLDILSQDERKLLLHTWNQTQAPYQVDRCIHELFEEQVEKSPDAIAVVQNEVKLSYAELNSQANRLAHRLIALGVGPGDFVATLLERSVALVVAQLAILKAGAVYVPIDPQVPETRCAWLIADCSASIVLSNIARAELPVTSLAVDLTPLAKNEFDNPDLTLSSRKTAYVMYTSGSTGVPKGVLVPHHAVNRLVINNGYLEFRSSDRVIWAGNPAFDSSTMEVWAPLLNGGTCIVIDQSILLAPAHFQETLKASEVTVMWLTVGFFNQIASALGATLKQLRALIVGGDSLDPKVIQRVLQDNAPGELINGYGPTETTTFAVTYSIADCDGYAPLPIGRPIANTRLYLLDAHGQPVPLGAIGELYIGGAGVALGYLNRPELTAERFLDDPFCEEPGARMYRSGDLARYRADGNLDFLGRADHQVKIRGFRIELGEIEARLANHSAIRETVVIARKESTGDKRLIAYVVPQTDAEIDVADLRAHLSRQLPDYMVPAAFVRLDQFPLTANGKLDRKALPAPDQESVVARKYESPHGEVETTLATVWSELLGIERVGRHDHFFELGGHSLLAVRLLSKLQSVLGVTLPLATLFARPTLASLAEAVAGASVDALPAIVRVSRDSPLPLSFAQQRLWFLAQMDGVSQTYHIPAGLHLTGPLDPAALRQSLDRLIVRHESLRTIFGISDGQPHVILLPPDCGFSLIEHDLQALPDAPALLVELMSEETMAPFDLVAGPLIRGRLIQLGPDDHVLLITQHHIVSDGWSIGVLVNELNSLYRAFASGHADPLPPLAIQYPDYAAWQRQWLSNDRLKVQADYWRAQLADAPVLLELPTDRPRPEQQSFYGASLDVVLDAELTRGLKSLAQQHGATLFMVVLAAWAAVLSRLSGQSDLIVSTPAANRNRQELEGLIGFFVNTLALRIDLSGEPSVADLLARVRTIALAAQDHQDVPFEQIVEIARPPRRLAHTPLFQVMFTWQSNAPGSLDLPGLMVKPVEVPVATIKFDLELELTEIDDCIVGTFGYATALFESTTIERQRGYLISLLNAMVTDATQSVARIELLSNGERHQLLHSWNQTETPYAANRCVHELFEEQVRKTPDAIAVVQDEVHLTYGELNAQANRLAHRLIEIGVRPDSRVAICVDRRPHMVVGLLAILKAGGAYIPLDPAYPVERLVELLTDASPVLLLLDTTGRETIGGSLPESLVLVDLESAALERNDQPCTNIDPETIGLTSAHLAYVIYTSGSTGKPKGAMIAHSGLHNYLDWSRCEYAGNTVCNAVVSSPLVFDATITSLYIPLLTGGRLMLLPSGQEVAALELFLRSTRQSWLIKITPAHLVVLGQQLGESEKSAAGHVFIIGGEALPAPTVALWQQLSPQSRLINEFGPTETVVGCSVYDTRHASLHESISIGRPIANTRLYLLDAYGQPVPLGAVGELYIGGAGVARGYLNRPELTAERFLDDPFCSEPGARMYRSGDLARYRSDGNLDYLGRSDHQVKIRGFRIELGEIEARLAVHPTVRDAVVIARDEGGGNKRLVAYVTAQPETEIDVPDLRAHLLRQLPDYMVPAAFVRLDQLPLTTNGKLDRKALPAPDQSSVIAQQYEAPQGDVETTLAGIWSELLGIERIGRNDHFFELGGHSLLAVQMIERLRRAGLSIEVRALFAHPTLSALAATLGSSREVVVPANAITPETTAITPAMLPLIDLQSADIARIVERVPGGVANIQDIYALSPLQDGILFHHLLATEGDPYLLVSQMRFADRPLLDRFLEAAQQVVDRHDILRTAIQWEGLSTSAQVVWRQAPLIVTEVTLDPGDAGTAAEQLARRFDPRQHRIDLMQPPLLRFVIAQEPDSERWALVLLQHHLIGDHATLESMQFEVAEILSGRHMALTPPQPFRNLVAQARLGVTAEEHEQFFRKQLGDIDEPTLPFGLADVHRDGGHVLELKRMLPQRLADQLRMQARRLGVSLASLCHLAWGQVLARTSGRESVVFGTVLFGRMQGGEGADRAMGLFINTLPLRLDLDGTSVEDSVRKAHQQLAELLQHEHASLAMAQRCSGVAAPTPLFSALLNYRHNRLQEATAENATSPFEGIELLNAEERTNYPLTMAIEDYGQALGLTVEIVEDLSPERLCDFMQRALEQLAEALETTPRLPVRQLDILSGEERHQLLHTWNQTQVPYQANRCIHELFETQVEKTPDAVAVVQDEVQLRYVELNAQANRLAHRLIELGVRPDSRVAICVDRRPHMVVGLLAILKAGGAYVPLDPTHPVERLAELVADAEPLLLLTDHVGRQAFGDALPVSLVVLDIDITTPDWSNRSAVNPDPHASGLTSSHLAYLIYTSGSTGKPKGVMVEHRSVINLWTALERQVFEGRNYSTVAWNAPYQFDASVQALTQLLSGRRLVILSSQIRQDAAAFLRYLAINCVDLVDCTPSQLQGLLSSDLLNSGSKWPQALLIGGEPIAQSAWDQLCGEGRMEFHNVYGPTECTVDATLAAIDGSSGEPTIGRPIANTRLYLLDAGGQPVPLGAVGELYIGGAGVARGYLNRPELTAERFLDDPFCNETGARMYRSGDLARYRNDGTLEFLGRGDHQVKIRGFRIELGEIEARLADCTHVRDAVVVARAEADTEQRLVAYVTSLDGVALDISELRQQLKMQLPEYMVPAAYVQLNQLPMTPNGKLDRKALPAPDRGSIVTQQYETPQGDVETALATIWSELLGIERVGRHDHFFEMGGHSLLAVQMISRTRQAGLGCTLQALFTSPILADFALRAAAQSPQQHDVHAIPIRRGGSQAPVFFVPDGKGDYSYAFSLAQDMDPALPIYALPRPSSDQQRLHTIEAMALQMAGLIRSVQPHGPYRLAGYSSGGILAYAIAQYLMGIDEDVSFVGLIDVHLPGLNEPSYKRTSRSLFLDVLHQEASDQDRTRVDDLRNRSGAFTLATLIDEAKRLRLVPPQLDVETGFWDGAVDFSNAVIEYDPLTLPLQIHVFHALEESEQATAAGHENNMGLDRVISPLQSNPDCGWDRVLPKASIKLHGIPGDHYSMMKHSGHRMFLGAALSDSIAKTNTTKPAMPRFEALIPLSDTRKKADAVVFCIPGAGDNVTTFIPFVNAVKFSAAIYGLQPRGIQSGEVPHTRVESAAALNIQAISRLNTNAPIHLIGHSHGGLIALEMARQLHEQGRSISSLCIIDSDPPDRMDRSLPDFRDADIREAFVQAIEHRYELSLGFDHAKLNGSTPQFLKHLHDVMSELALISRNRQAEIMRGPLNTFAAAYRCAYQPASIYNGPIRVLLAQDYAEQVRRRTAEWITLLPQSEISYSPGNHYTILSETHSNWLASWWLNDRTETAIHE